MSNVKSVIRKGCIALLRRFPESSDIVANLLEQVEQEDVVTLVKPVRHRRITHRPIKAMKSKRPPKVVLRHKTARPPRTAVSYDVTGTNEHEFLCERHDGRAMFKLSRAKFDSVCSAIADGCAGTSELVSKTGMKPHLVQTALRFLKNQGIMRREKNKYQPVETDNWNGKSMAAWESVRKHESVREQVATV